MRLFAVAAVVLGGLAFWRRTTLKDDAERAKAAGKDAATRVTSRFRVDGGSESSDGDDSGGEDDGAEDADSVTVDPTSSDGDEIADQG